MNANNLTRQSNTHRCRVAQIVLSLRGADSEHIMQTEALCVRARVCVYVCDAERVCELEREIRMIKNQGEKKKSQTARWIS